MKIVVIGSYAPSLLLFRAPLLAEMVRRGHQVLTMAADGTPEITARLAAMGVGFVPLPLERTGLDPTADLVTLAAIASTLRRFRADAVLGYTIKPVIYGGLAAALARTPRRYALITGLGYSFMGQDRLARRALRRMVAALYRRALSGCRTVFFQNPDDLAEFEAGGLLPRSARRVVVRGSGVDVAHYAPAPLPAGPPVFLFIGRLLREKGILDYVEAARRVRARHGDVRFLVVGGLDPNPASVTQAELDRWVRDGVIEYLGEVADVRPVIAAASSLILPSYREGTPRAVLEAMSMQRAVITTDAPGCRETVVSGDSGLLVPVRDPAALTAAIESLLASPHEIGRLGARARARVEELYDAPRVANAMLDAAGL